MVYCCCIKFYIFVGLLSLCLTYETKEIILMFDLMQMYAFYYLFLVHDLSLEAKVQFICCFSYAEE